MRIVERYSHLNGWEHIMVHKPQAWADIEEVIGLIDAEEIRTKESKERGMVGRMLYSPSHLNQRFNEEFSQRGWHESRTSYWVTADVGLIRKTVSLSAAEQRQEILAAGKTPISSYNQTDFVKDRIAVEVQLGKYSFVAYDLFVKHMAFYAGDVIDVGVEILPMKAMSAEMSSGISYYEGELYNVIRQGWACPPCRWCWLASPRSRVANLRIQAVTDWQKMERVFYHGAMNERPAKLTPISSPRAAVCPNCGGATDRPYLDCSRCRARRWRMTPAERRATWASFPGLDESEPISLDEARAKRRPQPESDADKAAS